MNKLFYDQKINFFLGFLVGINSLLMHYFSGAAVIPLGSFVLPLSALLYRLSYDGKNSIRLLGSSLLSALLIMLPLFSLSYYYGFENYSNSVSHEFFMIFIAMPLYAFLISTLHNVYHKNNTLFVSYDFFAESLTDLFQVLMVSGIFLIFSLCFFTILKAQLPLNLWYLDLVYFCLEAVVNFMILGGVLKNLPRLLYYPNKLPLGIRFTLSAALFFVFIINVIEFHQSLTNLLFGTALYFIISAGKWLSLLLLVTGLSVVLFNILYLSGKNRATRSKPFEAIMVIFRFSLFVSSLLLLIKLFPLYPMSFTTGVCLVLQAILCGIYAFSIVLPEPQAKHCIQTANTTLTYAFILLMILLNNPFYPIGISQIGAPENYADNQRKLQEQMQEMSNQLKINAFERASLPVNNKLQGTIDDELSQLDAKLAKSGLFWKKTANTNALPVCRTKYNGYQVGSYQQGQCIITYGGNAITATDFEILTGDASKIDWQTTVTVPQQSLATGIEPIDPLDSSASNRLRYLYSCRVQYQGKIYFGKLVGGDCNIAVNKQEIRVPGADVMIGY